MSSVVKTLFGGTDDSAQKGQMRQNAASTEYIQSQAGQSRNDLANAYQPSQQAVSQGFQGAMNAFGQAAPQQLNALQGGNMAAQQALMSGMPMYQRALMGLPMDYQAMAQNFQPYQQQFDPSMFQQQLPQAISNPNYQPLQQGGQMPQMQTQGARYQGPESPPDLSQIPRQFGGYQ